MTGCCAFGCSNKSEKGYKMYRFPADPQRQKIWENKVSRVGWKPTSSSCLCEIHFDESQFENRRADGKKKLKWQAVPTIFCHRSVLKPRRPLKRLPCTPNAVSATKKLCVSFDHTYCINPADKTTSSSVEDTATEEENYPTTSSVPPSKPRMKMQGRIKALKTELRKPKKQYRAIQKAKTETGIADSTNLWERSIKRYVTTGYEWGTVVTSHS